MLKIKFHEDGTVIADKKNKVFVEQTISNYLNNGKKDMTVVVANALTINFFRLAIKEKTIEHKDIVFLTSDDFEIFSSENGFLTEWPEGFCDDNLILSMNLL